MTKCPVCDKETGIVSYLVARIQRHHCGRVRLLSNVDDHYLTFQELPKPLPTKGCPICGDEMEDAGKFTRWSTGEEEGLERMICDKDDHYVYVTKEWYGGRK